MSHPDFWKSKKVFLTGHTGFKGAWLSLWLNHLGAKVTGYSLKPPTEPSLFDVANVKSLITSLEGDVRDREKLGNSLKDSNPDIVIHMAAQSLVRESYKTPVETYDVNIMGTVHLLEAVRTTPSAKACLIVTSDKCYENLETSKAYKETDAMGGHDPYSSSKGCAEIVTSAYRSSFFSDQKIASARVGNVIGGGDWATDRLVPDMVRALSRNESIKIRNPDSIRPWQHVLEPLHGYLILCEKLYLEPKTFAQGWNFGPSIKDAKKVSEIANTFVSAWGGNAQWELATEKAPPHEATLLSLDSSKAQGELEWKSYLDISKSIEWIVEWHQAHNAKKDMQAVTFEQIKKYESLVGANH